MARRLHPLGLAACLAAWLLLPAAAQAGGEILLGMSTALSGPAADLGRNMLLGVRAGLARANRAGGIHGCRLRLVALDDGYEPARTAPNMRRLVDEEGVLAVVGNVGTPTAVAALPIADEARCLLFAPFTGAGVLRRTPPDRYVINVRASYAEETAAMVEALAAAGVPPERVAFFTQRDAYGDAGYAGGIAALRRHGLGREAAVVHTRYERNTVAVENAVADLLLADPEPQAVIMVGAYAPCARFIRLVEAAGMDPLFLNVSFVGSASLARELGETRARVVVTQVVPHPEDTSLPLVRDYRRDLARLERGAAPTFVSLEGYLAARVLTLALERLPGPPTREGVVEALEGLGDFDLGLGVPLHLDAREHQACHRVWPTLLEAGRFRPFDWAELPALLHRGAGR